jgi:predicted oxidoreductase
MLTISFPHTPIQTSRIALGCMHFGGHRGAGENDSAIIRNRAREALQTAWESGIRLYDHADIYAGGESETMFAMVAEDIGLHRETYTLQTKCGIRPAGTGSPDAPGRYDFSYEHITRSVDGSLKRLNTDYIDILLLHRPDALMEPAEIAQAFDELHDSGKVRHFGVSNFTPAQLELLRHNLRHPLVTNQVEINLLKTSLIDCGIVSNTSTREPATAWHANGTLEYCRVQDIVVQAWAPLAYGYLSGRTPPAGDARIAPTAHLVQELAHKYSVPTETIVISWLLRHPAGIQPVVGTRDSYRIRACCQACSVSLTREDWYRLYIAGRGSSLP